MLADVFLARAQDRRLLVDLVLPDRDVLAEALAEQLGGVLRGGLAQGAREVKSQRTCTLSSSTGVVLDRNVVQPFRRRTPRPRPKPSRTNVPSALMAFL